MFFRFFGSTMSWEAPLFRGIRISESELDELSQKAEMMAKDDTQVSSPVFLECPSCLKMYSEPCPVAWELDESGACHAPSEYLGYCMRDLSFGGWSVESKIVAEMSCSMCWPCSNSSSSKGPSVPK